MIKTIALVSCVKTKHNTPLPSRDLYCSDWFMKASAYAEKISDKWYILSALYGFVHPDEIIAPYEKKCNQMKKHERQIWALKVFQELDPILEPGFKVVILASICYREFLLEPIKLKGCLIEIPMEGLKIGEQLRWLNEHLISP